MKKRITIFIYLMLSILVSAQTTDKEFEELYKTINAKKTFISGLSKQDSNYTDYQNLGNETYLLLDHLYDFMDAEHRLNGKGFFTFAGNESKNNNNYNCQTHNDELLIIIIISTSSLRV